MKKLMCFLLSCVLLLSSCSNGTTQPVEKQENSESSNASYPITVTDQAGREVLLTEEPQTIISNYYISTSLLIALDQDDKLVGVENNAELRPIYELSADPILELPGMGTVKEFDLERCAAIDPDLVILPAKLKDLCSSLEELDIPVLIVMPESKELLSDCIELLGTACGSEERAEQLNAFIEQKWAELDESLASVTEKPSVYLSGNSSFLRTAGPEMYQGNLLQAVAADNVAGDLTDTYWADISYEQLLAWDPSVIIMASDAKYSREAVLSDVNLSACTAVKEGRIVQIPNALESWDSPVPGSVLSALWMASVLHPEAYSTQQFEQATVEFYETFYGFTPNVEELYESK